MNNNPWVVNHIQRTCPECKTGLVLDDKINEECHICGTALCNCDCHNTEKTCNSCKFILKCGLK